MKTYHAFLMTVRLALLILLGLTGSLLQAQDSISTTLSGLPNYNTGSGMAARINTLTITLDEQAIHAQPGQTIGWGFKINWQSNAGDRLSMGTSTCVGDLAPVSSTDYVDIIGIYGGNVDGRVDAGTSWEKAFVRNTQGLGYITIRPDAVPGAQFFGNLRLTFSVHDNSPDPGNFLGTYTLTIPVAVTVDPPTPAINPEDQTITFDVIPAKNLGAAPFTLTATSSSGLPVTLRSLFPDICTVTDSTATILSAGTCTFVAEQEGNHAFNAALPVYRTVVINKNTATVALNGATDRNFTGTAQTFTATTTPANLPVTILYNGDTEAPVAPGIYLAEALIADPQYTGRTAAVLKITTVNTPPLAPDGNATATTGDQKTITLPASDPNMDTLVITSITAGANITVNSTNGLDVTFTPSANFAGNTTLGYTVDDGNGGNASGIITIAISDNDAPTIGGTFSPTLTYVGTLPDYTSQATRSDNIGVTSVTQSPLAGTATTAGTVPVTLTAKDAAGNMATTSFTLTVRPAAAESTKEFANGDPAPGKGTNGLPADAVLASFNTPATNDDGDLAFLATWTSASGAKGTGLFMNQSCLAITGGTSPIAGAKYVRFTDPVVYDGKVVTIATITGKPSTIVLSNIGGTLEAIAQAGGNATADGAQFKSFKAADVAGGYAAVFAQLANNTGTTPRTSAANDHGLWVKSGSGPLTLALREGQTVAGKVIKTLVTFVPGKSSPGQGRGWLSPVGKVMALAFFTDKTQGIIAVDAANIANPSVLSLTAQTGDGSPALTGATFASYSFPALAENGASAFLGSLTVGPGGVTKANASGIFTKPALTGDYASIARLGDNAASNAKFSKLSDPVLSANGSAAFLATIKGGTAKGLAANTLYWQPAGSALELLAQGGAATVSDLPDAQWKSFDSLAITDRGPIFAAKLVAGKGGITAKTASGVWACDFTGTPRLLFRTGDTVAGKVLRTFQLLNVTVGNAGITRSFNNNAQVVWLATFTDRSTAIITTEVP